MRHRTYYCQMPTDAATMPYLDIFVGGSSVGSQSKPVGYEAGQTVPPAGWQMGPDFAGAPGGRGDGSFFENLGLALRVEDGEAGVFRLGAHIAIVSMDPDEDCRPAPRLRISSTLLGGAYVGVYAIALDFPDPAYGPSLRLLNTVDTQGGVYQVNVIAFNAQEVDKDKD